MAMRLKIVPLSPLKGKRAAIRFEETRESRVFSEVMRKFHECERKDVNEGRKRERKWRSDWRETAKKEKERCERNKSRMKFISRMANGYWSSAFSSYLEVDTNFHFSWLWNNASRFLSPLPSVHVPAPAFAYFVGTRLYRCLSPLDNLPNRKATMIPRRRKISLEWSIETRQRSLLLRTTNGCGAFVNVKTITKQ